MPLRDHFHPPLARASRWDSFHGQWPAMMVLDLNRRLPARYVASPVVHLGSTFEIDVSTMDTTPGVQAAPSRAEGSGGGDLAVWAPPEPTAALSVDLPDVDEYEVQIYDSGLQRLVAAVEIISPANKDRAEHRRLFATKCASLIHQGVSVAIVDIVTDRRGNLYGELLDLLDQNDPFLTNPPPSLYAVELRRQRHGPAWRLQNWAYRLTIGQPLPTLPLWIAEDLAVPLELEATYEETCRALRIT